MNICPVSSLPLKRNLPCVSIASVRGISPVGWLSTNFRRPVNGLILKIEMLSCPRLVTYIDLPLGWIRIVPVVFSLAKFSIEIVGNLWIRVKLPVFSFIAYAVIVDEDSSLL